jgi:hypothetical protein
MGLKEKMFKKILLALKELTQVVVNHDAAPIFSQLKLPAEQKINHW